MRGGGDISGVRPCDACKVAAAALFCLDDSAFLCLGCDDIIHDAAGYRHGRVWLCELCRKAPAALTCEADAASLCATCDSDIHSANTIAGRHHRHLVEPFVAATWVLAVDGPYHEPDEFRFPNLNFPDNIVSVHGKSETHDHLMEKCFDIGFCRSEIMITRVTRSSGECDMGEVPDIDASNTVDQSNREARVLRYKEKRKNRKFNKTIRYPSRKAYAETRPRIKGRFAKRTGVFPHINRC